MSDFQNPKNGVLLIRAETIGLLRQRGLELGLLFYPFPDSDPEWVGGAMVSTPVPGWRPTGQFHEVPDEGIQEIIEWSEQRYSVVIGADFSDQRWQQFDVVTEQPPWNIDGWNAQ